ncbi:MAG TPA: hypothetical protein VFQ35_04365 [Polyangiaceae bacterium]|nr:hypothetical protein [Polyangiaceae bacterium]
MKKILLPLCAAVACNVENTTPDTGGVGVAGAGGCSPGISVVLSDYASTQVALSTLEGQTLSRSFISTGSAKTDGLSFALSGDVVLPSSRPASGRVVLVDRFGTNVLTWLDPATARVLGQLAVGTGFDSNPSDYLELDDQFAFVSRYGQNPEPGRQPFDIGGDLLLVDSRAQEIVGSLPFEATEDLPPRPSGMMRLGDEILVSLVRNARDFSTTGDSELAGVSVSTRRLDFRMRYEGLKHCGRPALSPSGDVLAVACTGALDIRGVVADVSQSALLLLDARELPPRELRRFSAAELGNQPIQSSATFARDALLLLKTQTSTVGTENNRWLALDLESGKVTTLLEASPDAQGKGRGVLYGGMSCSPGCSEVCLLADADRGALQRVRFDPLGAPELLPPIVVDAKSGLPPRDIVER